MTSEAVLFIVCVGFLSDSDINVTSHGVLKWSFFVQGGLPQLSLLV